MQVQESKIEKSCGGSAFPSAGVAVLYSRISILDSPRRVSAVVVVLLFANMGGCQDHNYSDHRQQALKAIDDRDFPLAQIHLNRCLEDSPFNAEANFLLARVCRRVDDFAGWQDHLQNAAILGWPQDQVYLEVRLKEAQVDNTWKVEEELKNYLTSGHPEQALIVEALVKGYLENDRHRDAYRLAEEWVKNFPNDWLARLYHGRACQRGVRFEEAIADYEKVLELKPDQAEAHLWLATTLASNTQFDRAMEHYLAYLEVHPDDADALFGLAKCQFTQGDSQSARAALVDLLSKHPNHNAGLYLRAQLEQAESPEKALPWLRRALAFAPNQTDVLHNLILVLRALHRDAEADQYEKRLKDCHQKETQLIELITKVVREPDDKDNLDLRYQLAVLYLELGHEDEAAHWIQTILYVDGDHRPTLRLLADYWEKRGDSKRAAYYRDRAEGKMASRIR